MSFNPVKDLPDLTGRVALVTGGNTGIGFRTVQQLARKGAKVYLAARNESKATGALAQLEAEGLGPGHGEVLWLKLDLSDIKTTKQVAEDFVRKENRLDILVNNAAVLFHSTPVTVDEQGISEMMTVNHFSPFVLTQNLLPLLKQTAKEPGADVRIVTLSSDAHNSVPKGVRFRSRADFNKTYDGEYMRQAKYYGASKLANILWTNELQRRLDADGDPIICITLHPGTVQTDGFSSYILSQRFGRLLFWIASWFLTPPDAGAYTSVIAAASPVVRADAASYKSAYLVPVGRIGKKSVDAQSSELAAELWSTTEILLKEMGL